MMRAIAERVRTWSGGESGQDLIEYALIVGLIALVAVGALSVVGTTINNVFWTFISSTLGSV